MFWNAEHIGRNAQEMADRAIRRVERELRALTILAQFYAGQALPKPLTREALRQAEYQERRYPNLNFNREARAEARLRRELADAERDAEKYRNKASLAEDLTVSAPYVFFCEVEATHPDSQYSLLGRGEPGGGTLCYAHYQNGASRLFTNCPIDDGWCGLVNPIPNADRVPKSVPIRGSNGLMQFCFWHAPSGNNGRVVAAMYDGLIASGRDFVLFGDLNAEPNDVMAHGVPEDSVIKPICPTRISGRCLDYALTNRHDWFSVCRPLYNGMQGRNIKIRTGSDHMVMILMLK